MKYGQVLFREIKIGEQFTHKWNGHVKVYTKQEKGNPNALPVNPHDYPRFFYGNTPVYRGAQWNL